MPVSVGKLKNELSAFLNRAAYGQERIIVTSREKPKAAIISIDDLYLLEELEDAKAVRETLAAYSAGELLDWETVKTELREEKHTESR